LMQSAFDGEKSVYGQLIVWMMGILIVSKVFLSILLIIYSRKIADRIIGSNDEKLEAHPELAPVLTHVGILLLGLSVFVYKLPRFLGTTIQWFQSQAIPPESMAGQYNGAMANATLLIIIALFLMLRGKTLTRWLFRISK